MPRLQRLIALLATTLVGWVLVSASAGAAESIAVIMAQDAPDISLNAATLRDIYLKKIFLDDHDREYIPLNLPADHVLRRAFSLALFNKGAQELQSYWNQRYFHGITPPYVLASPQAVVQFVAKTPGAIGYVMPCNLDDRVKQVLTLPIPPSAQEALEKLCPSEATAGGAIPPE